VRLGSRASSRNFEGTAVSRNLRNFWSNDTASPPGRPEFLSLLLFVQTAMSSSRRDQTLGIGSGIISLKVMEELTQSRWFGNTVRMGDERHRKETWQARTQGRDTKEDPDKLGKKGERRFWRKEWLKKSKSISRDCECWEVVCKPSAPTGKRVSTSEVKWSLYDRVRQQVVPKRWCSAIRMHVVAARNIAGWTSLFT